MADSAGETLPFRATSEGVVLAIRLTPKAGRDEVEGVAEFGGKPVLKAKVKAVPDKGEANEALVRLVARWLAVPSSGVVLVQGGKSRLKQIAVKGEPEALLQILREKLGA